MRTKFVHDTNNVGLGYGVIVVVRSLVVTWVYRIWCDCGCALTSRNVGLGYGVIVVVRSLVVTWVYRIWCDCGFALTSRNVGLTANVSFG